MKQNMIGGILLAGILCCGQNLVMNGDFTNSKPNLYPDCRAGAGKLTLFTEDSTWNKCAKLEVEKITRTADGREMVNSVAWIGCNSKDGGFPVKPDTTYKFSLELKGNVPDAGISGLVWNKGKGLWNGQTVKATLGTVRISNDWKVFKGTFKTGPDAVSAAIQIQLWWNTQYGPQKYKEGDSVLIDNVVVEEETRTLDSPAAPAPAVEVKENKSALAAPAAGAPFSFHDFVQLKNHNQSSNLTVISISHNNENILIKAECAEPDGIVRGKKLWDGDEVEIFFECDGKLRQFAAGAGGEKFSTDNLPWNAKVSNPDGSKWILEAGIPFSSLSHGDSPVLKFNIARQRVKAKELLTWAPLKDTFHDSKNFGVLVMDDYAKAFRKLYGKELPENTRAGYEKAVAAEETALLKEKYQRFANRKFAVAPVPVVSDYAIPFVPDEIFDPVEKIELKCAVNERKALPVAIANLTDRTAEYRVVLETAEGYNGKYGLKDFPAERITGRVAVRFKDSDRDEGSLRLDPLPKINEACTVTVPPKQSGLVWFDFDTDDVKPGVYPGRLRVIPLSESGAWTMTGKGYHDRTYKGEMLDIPVSLEVRNIVLSKDPAIPMGFFQPAETESMFRLMIECGTRDFGISPWFFQFKKTGEGKLDTTQRMKGTEHVFTTIRNIQEWSRKYGIHPTFFIGFSAYTTCEQMYGEACWRDWIRGVGEVMEECGVPKSDYVVETWDEPDPKWFDRLKASHETARESAPGMRLLLTLGAHIMSADNMAKLDPLTDGWCLWSDGYFSTPEHKALIAKMRKAGKHIEHYTCDTSMRSDLAKRYRRNAWNGAGNNLSGNMMFIFSDGAGGFGQSDWKVAMEGGISYRSFDGFLPSIRYMALREGMTDIKYLAKYRAAGGDEKTIGSLLNRVLVENAHDPAEPDRVREELAKKIMELQK